MLLVLMLQPLTLSRRLGWDLTRLAYKPLGQTLVLSPGCSVLIYKWQCDHSSGSKPFIS